MPQSEYRSTELATVVGWLQLALMGQLDGDAWEDALAFVALWEGRNPDGE